MSDRDFRTWRRQCVNMCKCGCNGHGSGSVCGGACHSSVCKHEVGFRSQSFRLQERNLVHM